MDCFSNVRTKQSKIIQLEAQLKNGKQAMQQLEAALAKAIKTLERKDELFKTKYHEQKEHLEITLAVRHGLTNEQQVLELKKKLLQTALAKDKVVQLREPNLNDLKFVL